MVILSVLQWGRNFIVAETGARRSQTGFKCRASMGPQLYRCGDPTAIITPVTTPAMLQWGRNFIVAETSRLEIRVPSTSYALQWGRNFIVAETDSSRNNLHQPHRASMGPQLYRCGDGGLSTRPYLPLKSFNGAATLSLRRRHGNTACLWSSRKASMGPQLYRCGDGSSITQYRSRHCVLQWGRNFIVAETFDVASGAAVTFKLQWGRNFIVAETLSPSTHCRPM